MNAILIEAPERGRLIDSASTFLLAEAARVPILCGGCSKMGKGERKGVVSCVVLDTVIGPIRQPNPPEPDKPNREALLRKAEQEETASPVFCVV